MHRFAILFFGLALLARADDLTVLDNTDRAAIHEALRGIRMTETDLSFRKDLAPTVQTTTHSCEFLHDPLQLAEHAEKVAGNLGGGNSQSYSGFYPSSRKLRPYYVHGKSVGLVQFSMEEIKSESLQLTTMLTNVVVDPVFYAKLPTIVSQVVERIVFNSAAARQQLQYAMPFNPAPVFTAFAVENLNLDKDAPELAEWERFGLPVPAVRELLTRSDKLELQDDELAKPIIKAGNHLNWGWLHLAFLNPVYVTGEAADILKTNRFTEPFYAETDTELGKIIVNNLSHTVFTNEAFLIIDTGHDNVYLNSAGGANGLVGRPISIVIALGDNDQFVSRRSFSQGSGVFGIGILAALGSNNTFAAKHVSQGAGLFGCGMLMTGPGTQTFDADTYCQGAGMYGAGILWQRGDATTCRAAQMAQGFGGPGGCGLLLGEKGNSAYIAGGKYPCPWLPGQYFSLAQGFGYGMRPFAGGGVGILCNLRGGNRYIADVYGQGASYWYSTGLLLDLGSNNFYQAYQYCQGAGIHLSSGALVNWGGNNQFSAHAICQGGAHDYAVGMLIDRAGGNRYIADTTAQGAGINNSFAMLLNHGGDNFLAGRDPQQSQAAGHDGGKREYGSIALLLNLGGKNVYSQGQTNNTAWLKPWYGAGLDCETNSLAGQTPPTPAIPPLEAELPVTPCRPVDVHHPVERLLRLAISDKPDAGKAWEELKARGAEVLPYLLTRLDSPDVLVKAKIEELIDHLGTNSIPALIAGIDSAANDDVAQLCCYFLARFDTKAREAIPHVLPLLDRELTQSVAFYTLGHLRATVATGAARAALADQHETVRLRAAQALGRIGDRQAIPALIARLDDELWDVRYAAQDALVTLGKPSAGPLRAAFGKASPRSRSHIIAALAKLGDRRAVALAEQEYRNDNPLVRAALIQQVRELVRSVGRGDWI